eukprot:gnl/MRDRNA2_/MRDRNA2_34711_c0_seq1.p1 gnl/MRDRNA2_/MRDRNA2_34711_c0~~gnl/MRDRNA2_/MRDRNA2_34711_c0_seq1.p1  ORF type:complete len:443 (-),score=56.70 gnl/MRDRNA2_/MRDRNA2_34711_c0_seq1:63-1391(-)
MGAGQATAPSQKMSSIDDHYRLGRTLGEGAFGKVKHGTHILTGEKVAVKILKKAEVKDEEAVNREIQIFKLLRHPHIIQLFEVIDTPDRLYFIMERASGGELCHYILAHGRLAENTACRLFQQILAGVEEMHRAGVVHRDLHWSNILLDENQNIKIVDFGQSNTFQDQQLLKTACGKSYWAPPEMIVTNLWELIRKQYSPSPCDVWSCGVILFTMICGYFPFEAEDDVRLCQKILSADYQVPDFISHSASDLIAGILTTDPFQRLTIPQIKTHSWYLQVWESSLHFQGGYYEGSSRCVWQEDLLKQLDKWYPRDYVLKCLQQNTHNDATATYYLLQQKRERMMGELMGHQEGLGLGGLDQSQELHLKSSLEACANVDHPERSVMQAIHDGSSSSSSDSLTGSSGEPEKEPTSRVKEPLVRRKNMRKCALSWSELLDELLSGW